MKRLLLLGLAAGCIGAEPSPAAAEHPAAATAAETAWRAQSASGVPVELRPASASLHPGTVVFRITIGGAAGVEARSVDLVSSSMPLHGVVRFPLEPAGPASYLAAVEIPMEGHWSLYVNLDDGEDAAAFDLEVAPSAPGGPAHDHAAHAH